MVILKLQEVQEDGSGSREKIIYRRLRQGAIAALSGEKQLHHSVPNMGFIGTLAAMWGRADECMAPDSFAGKKNTPDFYGDFVKFLP